MSNKGTLSKEYASQMGYTVRLCEPQNGEYVILVGGIAIKKKNGDVMVYRGLQPAVNRFDREVGQVEGWEAQLILAGKWHPVRLCDGGCGLEMRVTPREYPDGRVVTVEEQMNERRRCVSCGPFPTEGGQSGT